MTSQSVIALACTATVAASQLLWPLRSSSAPLPCAGMEVQTAVTSSQAPPAAASPASDGAGAASPGAPRSLQRDSIYVSTAQAMSRECASPQPRGARAPSVARHGKAGSLTTSAQAAALGLRQSPAAAGRAGVGLRTPWATYEVLVLPTPACSQMP